MYNLGQIVVYNCENKLHVGVIIDRDITEDDVDIYRMKGVDRDYEPIGSSVWVSSSSIKHIVK